MSCIFVLHNTNLHVEEKLFTYVRHKNMCEILTQIIDEIFVVHVFVVVHPKNNFFIWCRNIIPRKDSNIKVKFNFDYLMFITHIKFQRALDMVIPLLLP